MFKPKANEDTKYHHIEDHDEPKLGSETEEAHLMSFRSVHRRRNPFLRPLVVLVIVIFICLYSSLLVLATMRVLKNSRFYGTRFSNSPVNDYIFYEPQVFRQEEYPSNITYFTKPSPEVDRNWHEVFRYQNLGISPETMKGLGRLDQGIKLPDGNYYGSLMVFHHLHCLKNIYHALHPEYYGLNNLTAEEQDIQNFHVEHCLHTLKMGVMCQGDPTIVTMKWGHHGPVPIGNFSAPHECVNWDRLMEWVEPHSMDMLVDGVLVHPKFGPPFVNGKPANRFEVGH